MSFAAALGSAEGGRADGQLGRRTGTREADRIGRISAAGAIVGQSSVDDVDQGSNDS